jgi:hypothetical protein
MPKITAFIFLIFISCNLKAQTWELGAAVGGSGYMGDLNPTNPIKVSGISASGFVARNFNGYLSAKLNYTFGIISAADSNSNNQQFRDRNLSFTTTLSEIALIGEFNFMKYIPEAGRNRFTPFIYLGVASVNYAPTTIYQGTKVSLRDNKTEGQVQPYKPTAISIPYGAGVKYNILGKWTLIGDIGYRNPNTDYIDDVSGNYPSKTLLKTPLSVALSDRSGEKNGIYTGSPSSQRGDLQPHDTYFFIQVGISYTFVTSKCYF